MVDVIINVCSLGDPVLVGGDLNIDQNLSNDPTSRQVLRALYPHWDTCLAQNNLTRLNHNATRHMPGQKPSLLDLFYTNRPSKFDGVETLPNLLSEHSLVKLNMHTNLPKKATKFQVFRRYDNVVFSRIQELLDKDEEIQKIFLTEDVNFIADRINNALNSTVKALMWKKIVQTRKNQTEFWDKDLEVQRKEVEELKKVSDYTSKPEDYRIFKNKKNQHIREMKRKKKKYLTRQYSGNKKRWRQLKKEDKNQDAGLKEVMIKGECISSPIKLANAFTNHLIDKINKIAKSLPYSSIVAEKVFKWSVPRQPEDFKFKMVRISEVYKIIMRMKRSKSRGNNEITSEVLKETPHFISICMTHLINNIMRHGVFPDCMKTSRVIPILKPGKQDDNIDNFRPINNLNPLEKVVEGVIKGQMESFLKDKNVVPKEHHRARKAHNTLTAKLNIDENINMMRNKQKNVVVLNSDLTAAYDTVDHGLLLTKIEHVGLRGVALKLMSSYLLERQIYSEVQGSFSKLKTMPNKSVVQGSILSGFLFTIYSLEVSYIPKMMKNEKIYKMLTGETLVRIQHKVSCYMDDVQNVIGHKSNQRLEIYINQLHKLLIGLYSHNYLKINETKTEFIHVRKTSDKSESIAIKTDRYEIKSKKSMKILGFITNERMTLDTHLSGLMSKIGLEYHKLRPALDYMDLQTRRIVMDAKVKTHVEYILPLVISQPQYVQNRVEKILMKINRWTLQDNTFKMRNATICKRVGCPTPNQQILRSCFKFFHNLVKTKETKSLIELISFPRRITSKLSYKCPKKQCFRTPLEAMTDFYNQQDAKIKALNKKQLKRKIKKLNLKYKRD